MAGSTNHAFLNYLKAVGEIITGQYRASKLVKHRGRKGSAREGILADAVRRLLPDRFGIGAAEIRAVNGQTSPEFGLIIYDKRNCAILYNEKSVQVYPIESVYAVVSARSRLDAAHLRKFSNCLRDLRDLRLFPRSTPKALLDRSWLGGQGQIRVHPTPGGFVFGFEGSSLAELSGSVHTHYVESAAQAQFPPDPVLNCVCVIGRGIITQIVGPGGVNTIYPFPSHPEDWDLCVTTVEHGDLAFPFFAACLIYVLTETFVFPPALAYYTSAFAEVTPPISFDVIRRPIGSALDS